MSRNLLDLMVVDNKIPSAVCAQVDPELFFPERGGSSAPAKKICNRCPEKVACLEDALAGGERFGIRGGTSERERRKMLKERKDAK